MQFMSIIYKKDRQKAYYFSFSTGQKLANGSYKRIHSVPVMLPRKKPKQQRWPPSSRSGTAPTSNQLKWQLLKCWKSFWPQRLKYALPPEYSTRHLSTTSKNIRWRSRPLQKAGVLDVEDCRKFLYDQVDSGRLSMSTIREDLSFLCSAFTWAADVDLIYKSPARRLKLPPKTKPQGIHTPVENIMEILRIVKIDLTIPYIFLCCWQAFVACVSAKSAAFSLIRYLLTA